MKNMNILWRCWFLSECSSSWREMLVPEVANQRQPLPFPVSSFWSGIWQPIPSLPVGRKVCLIPTKLANFKSCAVSISFPACWLRCPWFNKKPSTNLWSLCLSSRPLHLIALFCHSAQQSDNCLFTTQSNILVSTFQIDQDTVWGTFCSAFLRFLKTSP